MSNLGISRAEFKRTVGAAFASAALLVTSMSSTAPDDAVANGPGGKGVGFQLGGHSEGWMNGTSKPAPGAFRLGGSSLGGNSVLTSKDHGVALQNARGDAMQARDSAQARESAANLEAAIKKAESVAAEAAKKVKQAELTASQAHKAATDGSSPANTNATQAAVAAQLKAAEAAVAEAKIAHEAAVRAADIAREAAHRSGLPTFAKVEAQNALKDASAKALQAAENLGRAERSLAALRQNATPAANGVLGRLAGGSGSALGALAVVGAARDIMNLENNVAIDAQRRALDNTYGDGFANFLDEKGVGAIGDMEDPVYHKAFNDSVGTWEVKKSNEPGVWDRVVDFIFGSDVDDKGDSAGFAPGAGAGGAGSALEGAEGASGAAGVERETGAGQGAGEITSIQTSSEGTEIDEELDSGEAVDFNQSVNESKNAGEATHATTGKASNSGAGASNPSNVKGSGSDMGGSDQYQNDVGNVESGGDGDADSSGVGNQGSYGDSEGTGGYSGSSMTSGGDNSSSSNGADDDQERDADCTNCGGGGYDNPFEDNGGGGGDQGRDALVSQGSLATVVAELVALVSSEDNLAVFDLVASWEGNGGESAPEIPRGNLLAALDGLFGSALDGKDSGMARSGVVGLAGLVADWGDEGGPSDGGPGGPPEGVGLVANKDNDGYDGSEPSPPKGGSKDGGQRTAVTRTSTAGSRTVQSKGGVTTTTQQRSAAVKVPAVPQSQKLAAPQAPTAVANTGPAAQVQSPATKLSSPSNTTSQIQSPTSQAGHSE